VKRPDFILILAVLLLISVAGCERRVHLKVGEILPAFTLPDLKGDKVVVPDDFRGKVVVIRFWVDWCASCAREMPLIDDIYKKYKDRGLIILAVNVGQPRDVAAAFVSRLKISYPALLDTESVISHRYYVTAVPTTYILDRSGVIRNKILGETGTEAFEKIILDLL